MNDDNSILQVMVIAVMVFFIFMLIFLVCAIIQTFEENTFIIADHVFDDGSISDIKIKYVISDRNNSIQKAEIEKTIKKSFGEQNNEI